MRQSLLRQPWGGLMIAVETITVEVIAVEVITVEAIAVEVITVETITVEAIASCATPGGGSIDNCC